MRGFVCLRAARVLIHRYSLSTSRWRTMTRFSYSDYIQLFRSNDARRERWQPKTLSPGDTGEHTGMEEVESNGWTALHEAAHQGHTDSLHKLLKSTGVSVDERTLLDQTPLMLAVQADHQECVWKLLEAGADPDICDQRRQTPLYKACEQVSVATVERLLLSGASVNQRCAHGRSALHEAAKLDSAQICKILLSYGANVNAGNTHSETPALEAAREGSSQSLKLLIQNGADVNLQSSNGSTALIEACTYGHIHTVKLLLRSQADANLSCITGEMALHAACRSGNSEIVSQLLPVSSRSRLSKSGLSPLHLAAESGHPAVLRQLLCSGWDPDSRDPTSRSCLQLAVLSRKSQAVMALLEARAEPEGGALLQALVQDQLEMVGLLLRFGAGVSFPALLMYTQSLPVLRELLEHGCPATTCFKCRHEDEEETGSKEGGQIKFCEWLGTARAPSSPSQVVDLLLDYVGNVRLCRRIIDLILSSPERESITERTTSPRRLLHFCRMKIRDQLGAHRLNSIHILPLPAPLRRYLLHSH
ncbi:hypothetical protein DNTS_008148 [Danionella cerebrum]|uniref:SOCS box domain-containing protein n=1 Tax=Danionella cerebrum TaxID=2873325 RepID=A0A553PUR3_9TELE|nr:hypothetical protein DNTS_008148 [Danionella translucida]